MNYPRKNPDLMINHKILDRKEKEKAAGRTPNLIRLNAADLSELADYLFRIQPRFVPVKEILADLKAGNGRIFGMRVEFDAAAREPILGCEAVSP